MSCFASFTALVQNILADAVVPVFRFVTSRQWRIKGGADGATARGPHHLGVPNF